jgi:hypothetical protein
VTLSSFSGLVHGIGQGGTNEDRKAKRFGSDRTREALYKRFESRRHGQLPCTLYFVVRAVGFGCESTSESQYRSYAAPSFLGHF